MWQVRTDPVTSSATSRPGPLDGRENRGLKSRVHETVEAVMMNADFPRLFSPFTIKNMTLRNRVCSTAHFAEWMADEEGLPNAECVAYMAERAEAGMRRYDAGPSRRSNLKLKPGTGLEPATSSLAGQ